MNMGNLVRTGKTGTVKDGATVYEGGIMSFFSGVKSETVVRSEAIVFVQGKLMSDTLSRAETAVITNT
jgi:hypothetical protein